MKQSKKKKTSGTSNPAGGVSKDVGCVKTVEFIENSKQRDVNNLTGTSAMVSLDDYDLAYREPTGGVKNAAEILGGVGESAEDQSTVTSSSTSQSTGSSRMEEFADNDYGRGLKGRKSKQKKVVATAGIVSTVLGKDYMRTNPKTSDLKTKEFIAKEVNNTEAEQFLYSMLGDGCELSMAVVRDVLCQCGYDAEKALNALLELSASSWDQSKAGWDLDSAQADEDMRFLFKSSVNLTDRASDSVSHSSESEIQDSMWSFGSHFRSYSMALASPAVNSSIHPGKTELELSHEVLESLFNMSTPKSCEHNPNTMNWRNVVKKMQSLGHKVNAFPDNTELQQDFHGDEYNVYRKLPNQHWDKMRKCYQKAATAYTNGKREYAAFLSEQGRLHNKLAREADEKASKDIFNSRNKNIENVITIDLHGQHVKQAMRLLKLHLLFGACIRSVRLFRVITGCGSHGVGKSKLKQSIINLVKKEGIKWSEENRGTLMIRLDGQEEFSFLDSNSDSD